jgi:mannose-1-phosphate guanylyltransferase/mannose-6-phosphate isomerase
MANRNVLIEVPQEYREVRPWGEFRQLIANEPCTVKLITVNAGEQLSLQSHERRSELWLFLDPGGVAEVDDTIVHPAPGETVFIPCGARHRLAALPTAESSVRIVEVGFGDFDENDIVRYEDRYGRA